MDIGNLDNLFNKKKVKSDTEERSISEKGKEASSLNNMMHQVGDYDIKTSSSVESTKHDENSDSDDDTSRESSKTSAKRAAVNAIATAASVIAPTTATAPVVPPHN
ncbi:unnamed protein product [Absidia cylindrospora]